LINNSSLLSALIKFNNIHFTEYFNINMVSNACKNFNFFIELGGTQVQTFTHKKEKINMTKTSSKMGIHEQIIESAGQIYNYLNSKGEVSISKMKKDLSLADNFAEMGLGWLSREDKLEYTQKAKETN